MAVSGFSSGLRAWGRSAAKSAFYFCLAVALTWPILPNAGTHLPIGSEGALTVPLFNLWSLEWAAERIALSGDGFWNAPIFYPHLGSFALSEAHVLAAPVFAALRSSSASGPAAYVGLILLAVSLNGLGGHRLAESLRASGAAAYGTGLLAASLPFVANEIGVLQLQFLFPVFFGLAEVARFADRAEPAAIVRAGLWVAVAILSNGYYGLAFGVLLLPAVFFLARPEHWGAGPLLGAVVGAAAAAILVLPVLLSQAALTSEFERGRDEVVRLGATPRDYLRLGDHSWGAASTPWLVPPEPRAVARLYPGTALLVLALVGVAEGWRRRQRRWVLYSGVGAALAALVSFGFQDHGVSVFGMLHAVVPGFERMRSPYRVGVFVQVFMVGLAALGLRFMLRWPPPLGVACFTAVLGLGLLEIASVPRRLADYPANSMSETWIEWLKAEPPGAVLSLPMPVSGWVGHYEGTVVAMLQGLEHGHPLVNGYSGFFPPEYNRVEADLRSFPSERAWATIDRLAAAGVRYAVARKEWLVDRNVASVAAHPQRLRVAFVGPEVVVFRLADLAGSG